MSEPRKHHLVPRFYQRAFARRRGNRWEARVVDLDHPERGGVQNIENVFVQRDFNTVQDAEGNKEFAVEHLLADYVDGPASRALEGLRADKFPLIEPWWDAMALFMATQLTRGRATRENLTEFVSELQHLSLGIAAANYTDEKWIEVLGSVPDKDSIERMAKSREHVTIRPTNAYLLELALAPVAEVAEILAKRIWTLIEFAEPCLLTAENPVVHINPSGEDMGFGVMTAQQMYLPVSPTQGLLLSHPWADWPHARMCGGPALAAKLNWAVLMQPVNRRFLLHPDIEGHPLPGVALLLNDTWWPWGPDPKSEPPVSGHYRRAAAPQRG